MESVAALLAKHFKKWNISHMFGVPGKAILPIIQAADQVGIQFVLSSHEGAAGFEAAGYAWGRQTLGVCLGTSGPGGTNLVTAAAQAKASNMPVLIITGHPTMKGTGVGLGQDASPFGTDIVKVLEPVTKFSMRLERGDLLEIYLKHALDHAFIGVKGPVHLSIPFDVFMERIPPFDLDIPQVPLTSSDNLDKVIAAIKAAERPVILAGKGVHSAQAYAELQEVAERWDIPVMTTTSAKGTFPTGHRLSLGGLGLGGTPHADQYLEDGVDLMLVLGTKLSDMTLSGFNMQTMLPAEVIQFDYDPMFVGKAFPCPTVSVLGDIKANLRGMLNRPAEELSDEHVPLSVRVPYIAPSDSQGPLIATGDAIRALQAELPREAVLFGDCGSHTFYAIRDYTIHEAGTFIFDSLFGAMGHAIGYSVGAKLARPDLPIVCLTGDGCMLMHGTEISTAVNYDAPLIFVVINNGRLDMVEKGMVKYLGKAIGAVYNKPIDAAMFGEALGARGYRCYTVEDIRHAVKEALTSSYPSVIDIIVDPFETPPTMKR
ncbi:thiamine pyrophosphate-binding protein [Paenibacillus mendelii]|uniref:Thiamine pyrophosphate-binding protein n=1 Tax=Paenibacillus mendelii TaxID=206163 RepID=A0ABV6JAH9_9BACL|nr:thiamine pyrophosphate-binding protein [Paenibacillus mendelii]MCQ6559827.1 thiamine pyrophosphate-binding protein [Paenibacillus mendelii]